MSEASSGCTGPAEPGRKQARLRWSSAECDRLAAAVAAQTGPKICWTTVAAQLPGRSAKQCRFRWHNQPNETTKTGQWEHLEELIIASEHAARGSCWARTARLLACRTENMVKNHWNSVIRSKSGFKPCSILWLYARELNTSPDSSTALQSALKTWREYVADDVADAVMIQFKEWQATEELGMFEQQGSRLRGSRSAIAESDGPVPVVTDQPLPLPPAENATKLAVDAYQHIAQPGNWDTKPLPAHHQHHEGDIQVHKRRRREVQPWMQLFPTPLGEASQPPAMSHLSGSGTSIDPGNQYAHIGASGTPQLIILNVPTPAEGATPLTAAAQQPALPPLPHQPPLAASEFPVTPDLHPWSSSAGRGLPPSPMMQVPASQADQHYTVFDANGRLDSRTWQGAQPVQVPDQLVSTTAPGLHVTSHGNVVASHYDAAPSSAPVQVLQLMQPTQHGVQEVLHISATHPSPAQVVRAGPAEQQYAFIPEHYSSQHEQLGIQPVLPQLPQQAPIFVLHTSQGPAEAGMHLRARDVEQSGPHLTTGPAVPRVVPADVPPSYFATQHQNVPPKYVVSSSFDTPVQYIISNTEQPRAPQFVSVHMYTPDTRPSGSQAAMPGRSSQIAANPQWLPHQHMLEPVQSGSATAAGSLVQQQQVASSSRQQVVSPGLDSQAISHRPWNDFQNSTAGQVNGQHASGGQSSMYIMSRSSRPHVEMIDVRPPTEASYSQPLRPSVQPGHDLTSPNVHPVHEPIRPKNGPHKFTNLLRAACLPPGSRDGRRALDPSGTDRAAATKPGSSQTPARMGSEAGQQQQQSLYEPLGSVAVPPPDTTQQW